MEGALELRIGPDDAAALVVDGVLDLSGAVLSVLADLDPEGELYDFTLGQGDSFDLVSATQINGTFDTLFISSYIELDEGLNWQTEYVTENGFDILPVTVVPIPAAAWLFASALAGLGWMRRKQSA
ncbi:MAG: VPLPA-CTERM sorting domain-containing protein [Gammaproteobacteria bacterium]|nr:VPLPA-CTERM sorting domain-containing protein [Gammaproteobacteria bacterium]